MPYKVLFCLLGETLVCDHSNESYWRAISRGDVCFNILENCNLELNYEFAFLFLQYPIGFREEDKSNSDKMRSFTITPNSFLKDLTLSQRAEHACEHCFEKWKTRNHFISTVFKAELYPNCTNSENSELWWTYREFFLSFTLIAAETLRTSARILWSVGEWSEFQQTAF